MALRGLLAFRGRAKLVDSYTRPLLADSHKGICDIRRGGIAMTYPAWYICPSRHDMDQSREGGTIQGRITCKRPAFQTSPTSIKKCRCSRFRDGVVIMADLKQIEWRIAGLLSGDPILLEEFISGKDPHAIRGAMAYSICRDASEAEFWALPPTHELRKTFRFMGKTLNFLLIYGGQASKLQETIRKDVGYVITYQQAQKIITFFDSRYCVLRRWQSELVKQVSVRGRIELLTGWSRLFPGGKRAVELEASTIKNFPVQTYSAQLLQSAQYQVHRDLWNSNLSALVDMNIYDAIHVDSPREERGLVRAILDKWLPHPPLLEVLQKELNRTVPIEYDIEEIFCHELTDTAAQ